MPTKLHHITYYFSTPLLGVSGGKGNEKAPYQVISEPQITQFKELRFLEFLININAARFLINVLFFFFTFF
jgi:hypothetical protein